jgi:Protein NO VEIN, C-terminal
MLLNPGQITTREKLILTGLYLSKYDSAGVKKLGFESFIEAFNVVGYALASKPASIKNYRDEFDPLVSKRRKGWHKRPTRAYCLKVFQQYKDLDFEAFTGLIRSFVGYDDNLWSEIQTKDEETNAEAQFAKRLTTGLAAERYFETNQPTIPEFRDYTVLNTTRLGCGYDFRLGTAGSEGFLAVEVKGLKETTGSLSLTPKEHEIAGKLEDRFFLFVVKNFRETPFHEVYRNPLSSALRFARRESVTVNVSWLTSV